MNRKRLVLLFVLGALALSLLVGALVGGLLWLSADRREITHQFLGSVRTGRYDLAYELTSQRLRATTPPALFQSYVDGRVPNARRSTSDWINGEVGDLFTHSCMEAWLSGPGLDSDKVYLLMVKEGEVWRINELTTVEVSDCDGD